MRHAKAYVLRIWSVKKAVVGSCDREFSDLCLSVLVHRYFPQLAVVVTGTMTQKSSRCSGTRTGKQILGYSRRAALLTQLKLHRKRSLRGVSSIAIAVRSVLPITLASRMLPLAPLQMPVFPLLARYVGTAGVLPPAVPVCSARVIRPSAPAIQVPDAA